MIQFKNVQKRFLSQNGSVHALDGVDLAIEKGQFTVIRGPSGCGKSTLLMTMAGILRPTGGMVEIDGHNLYAMTGRKRNHIRARYFGFVFQMFHLVPYLNIVENVILAGVSAGRKADKARARQLLEALGLSDRMGHKPTHLSSGEKQRVAFARAIYNDPPVLLADEPTGNLDADNAMVIYEHLVNYHRLGRTVVLVTHDSNQPLKADRKFIMVKGRLT